VRVLAVGELQGFHSTRSDSLFHLRFLLLT